MHIVEAKHIKPNPPLSNREREVLALVANGLTNVEIGMELHISIATVKNHRSRIIGFLGANNMPHAVAIAIQRGELVVMRREG